MFAPLIIAASLLASTPKGLDPVTYSFAFFGCNRTEPDAWNPVANPSSANVEQLRRTFADIASLEPVPNLVFATGDLVIGYKDDQGEEVQSQLNAWVEEYRNSPLFGKTTLVPIAGNHELNRKVAKAKLPSPYTAKIWTSWLEQNSFPPKSANGPAAGGLDRLAEDQAHLTYSFESGPFHFVVLNTDARTDGDKVAWTPYHWAENDISQATKAGRTVVVLGHRNVATPASATGDSPIDEGAARELRAAFMSNRRVLAYVCAHVHAWDVTQLAPSKAWQIIAGNGGSKLEKDWHPGDGTTFGFGVIEVHRSGRITLARYGRVADHMPKPLPATKREEVRLGTIPKSSK